MEIEFAETYGFCQGVKSALKKIYEVKEKYPEHKIYILGELVHNQSVVDKLLQDGFIVLSHDFKIEELAKFITKDDILVFTAHGHDEKLDKFFKDKVFLLIDTTCPYVQLTEKRIKEELSLKHDVYYIGIKNHVEANATLSISNRIHFIDYKNPVFPDFKNKEVSIFNQTTLGKMELKNIITTLSINPNVHFYNSICQATTKRQEALYNLNNDVMMILIIGDSHSSNTLRLYELASRLYPYKQVKLVLNINDVKKINFDGIKKVFLTAGASTPDNVISSISEYIKNL